VSWRVSEEIDPSNVEESIRNPLCVSEFEDFPQTDDCVLIEAIP